MFPDSEEDFLRHVFCFGMVAKHPPGKTHHSGKMAAYQLGCGALVAHAHTSHQFLVRIPHGLQANSENRYGALAGNVFKTELLSSFMHAAATFAER